MRQQLIGRTVTPDMAALRRVTSIAGCIASLAIFMLTPDLDLLSEKFEGRETAFTAP
jgi:hypothetical protein